MVKHMWYLIICRIISSAGFGVMLPLTVPMTNFLVRKGGIETALAITAVCVPTGTIFATVFGGLLV